MMRILEIGSGLSSLKSHFDKNVEVISLDKSPVYQTDIVGDVHEVAMPKSVDLALMQMPLGIDIGRVVSRVENSLTEGGGIYVQTDDEGMYDKLSEHPAFLSNEELDWIPDSETIKLMRDPRSSIVNFWMIKEIFTANLFNVVKAPR